jgi:hypothetical protein
MKPYEIQEDHMPSIHTEPKVVEMRSAILALFDEYVEESYDEDVEPSISDFGLYLQYRQED